MTHPQLTAIILTYNEEAFLPDCLDSVRQLTASVLVLDSGSADRTVEIARCAGARVEQRRFDGFASQRNAALQMAGAAPWVLFVDADERLPARLAAEIERRLAGTAPNTAGYWIPRRNIVLGKALRGGGWWPDYQARLMQPERARYDLSRQVHEVVVFDGETGHLNAPLLHLNYASRREFINRQRRYTDQRVAQLRRNGFRPRRRAYLSGPAREFWRRLVRLRGYRDLGTGLYLASVLAFEEARANWMLRNGVGR